MDLVIDAIWQGLLHRRQGGVRRVVTETSPGLDFCVWILRRSALQSPPFDQHAFASPDQALAGLTAPAWNDWFTTVARRQAQALAQVRPEANVAVNAAVIRSVYDPVVLWTGDATIASALTPLWDAYRSEQREQRGQRPDTRMLLLPFTPRQQRTLWRQLRRLRASLYPRTIPETLYVFFVTYPAPVISIIPPDVVAVSGPVSDGGEFVSAAIVQAVETIVT